MAVVEGPGGRGGERRVQGWSRRGSGTSGRGEVVTMVLASSGDSAELKGGTPMVVGVRRTQTGEVKSRVGEDEGRG